MKRIKRVLSAGLGAIMLLQSITLCPVAAAPSKETGALKEKVLTDLPVSWDLTELYASEEAFEEDMKRAEELIPKIAAYRGTLHSVEGLLKLLEDPELLEIRAILDKANLYETFLNSLDATDPWAKAAAARFHEVEDQVTIAYAFEDPEIMEMPLKKRQEIISDERLAPYAWSLRRFTDPEQEALGEEALRVETLMGSAMNNRDTRNTFDNVELPRPAFTYPDGTEGKLTNSVFSRIMESKGYDQEFRRDIYELRNGMRQPYANTYASLLEGEMKRNWAKAQIHGYSSTLEAALNDSDVEPEVYDRIIEFAHSMLPKIYEYYEARKKVLELDEMFLSDMDQSITEYSPREVTYEEAVNTGRSAISVWGDEYLETFDKIMESPHVDVYPSGTKESGAYNFHLGNETTPFIMYNFNGSESYISTIVHEMGHAVYSTFSMENQNVYNNHPTIFTQEVTSTANELVFHRKMIDQAKTRDEKLYWLDKEIRLFIKALVTECRYSEFEDYCYKTIESGGALDTSAMAEKWIELAKEYYGDAVMISDDSGIEWAGIHHLFRNYYVYQYATSLTYAASICQRTEEKGQEAIDAYLSFLKAGDTDDPGSLLKLAGVDPLADETYEAAGELIGELIDEFVAETAGMSLEGDDPVFRERRDIPIDSEEFSRLQHEVFEANHLDELLKRHTSVIFDLTDAPENDNNWRDYFYATDDVCYCESPGDAEYDFGRFYYYMDNAGGGSAMIYGVNLQSECDIREIAGYQFPPTGNEKDWSGRNGEEHVTCYIENGLLYFKDREGPELSREWFKQYAPKETYEGQIVYSEVIADAKTKEIKEFNYYLESSEGSVTRVINQKVFYDEPEPRRVRNMRTAFERYCENMIDVTVTADPGTDREISESVTIPVGSIINYRCDNADRAITFDNAEATELSHWDGMRDKSIFIFTDPSKEQIKRHDELLQKMADNKD